MPVANYIAWAIYAGIFFTMGLFSVGFIKFYQSKRDASLWVTIVTMITLTIAFGMVTLIPLDIFLVSNTVDRHTGLKKRWADGDTIYWTTLIVQVLYYVFYGLLVFMNFFVLPFSYFYYEKYHTARVKALKYSSLFGIVGILLYLFGLFVKPNTLPPHINLEWFNNLLIESNGAKAFWFVVGCLFIPGMIVFIIYTAPGLSLVFFKLIKEKRRVDREHEEVNQKLIKVREQQRMIEHKYAASSAALSTHDHATLENLNDEERILLRQLSSVEEEEHHFLQRMLVVLRPFKVLIGIILLLLTLLMIASLFVTIIDKVTFSICGSKCGYIIGQTELLNPINFIFVQSSKLFPLDYVLMVGIIIQFFLATAIGISRIGIKFLWVTLYRIKKKSTSPQGLLMITSLLTFALFSFTYSITSSLAPGYTHFGSQVYCNHTEGGVRDCSFETDKIFPCDIWAPTEICTPTVTSTLIDRIILNTPTFGFIFYYSQWLFLVTFILGFFINMFKSPQNEEEQGLLDYVDA
jgi:LMBR1 domain-containing protein 1